MRAKVQVPRTDCVTSGKALGFSEPQPSALRAASSPGLFFPGSPLPTYAGPALWWAFSPASYNCQQRKPLLSPGSAGRGRGLPRKMNSDLSGQAGAHPFIRSRLAEGRLGTP